MSLLTLFPGRVGGSETYVLGLLAGLRERTDVRVTALANRHVLAAYGEHSPVLRPFPRYRPGDSDATRLLAMSAGRLWPTIDATPFDVVHYPVTVPVPRAPGAPRVVTLLDLQHRELPQSFSWGERRLRLWAYDRAAADADLVITISEHARASIVERLGIASERVRAIPLAVDHALFSPDGPPAEGLPERYLLYPANVWPHKNHERLLDAFARVQESDLHLVLTGQAYGREALVEGRDRVHRLGHVSRERLAAVYRGAVGLVFPSLFEGFGLPVLEAMASGTPVACSDRGALLEVAAEAALTFDPTDAEAIAAAMERLAGDGELRATLRQRGLERAAGFTWKATAAAHVDAYRQAARR